MGCLSPARRLGLSSLVLLALLGGTALDARAAEQIAWFRDLKEASEAAQRAGLPMFIDFWADWCAPCKVMDTQVYTNPAVVETFRTRIVGVRVHYDLQRDLARSFGVEALPYLVFTSSYGTPLLAHRGILAAGELVDVIKAMPSIAEINRLDRALQQDRNSFDDLVAMGRALRAGGFYDASLRHFERARRHRAARADPVSREIVLYESALDAMDLKDGTRAAALLETCLRDFPSSARKPDLLLALGRAYALDGLPARARRPLGLVISEYPESAAAADARALLQSLKPDR